MFIVFCEIPNFSDMLSLDNIITTTTENTNVTNSTAVNTTIANTNAEIATPPFVIAAVLPDVVTIAHAHLPGFWRQLPQH